MSIFEPDIEQVSSDWLISKLQTITSTSETVMVILDCRRGNDFEHLHIKSAVSFAIPAIMLRRFAIGKLDLVSIVRCPKLKSQLSLNYKKSLFVLYHSHDINFETVHKNTELAVFEVLYKRLLQDGCKVVCLKGGFLEFSISYPEYCESNIEPPIQSLNCDSLNDFNLPLLGLKNLKIENNINRINNNSETKKPTNKFLLVSSMSGINSSTESSDNDDNSTGFDDDKDFPVEILQNLFLGNATNSSDNESLLKNNITYILNVTSDLPNVFENENSIKYLQIPIMDHWSQNLASYFPKAIDFIEEARIQKKGVLVHCLAGISRSVTIIVAYLMYKCCLSMNDAFNLVRSRKSNIAPNFHFMQQLNAFEQELSLLNDSGRRNIVNDLDRRRCLEILDNINQTPDSGIEFDKYSKLQKSL